MDDILKLKKGDIIPCFTCRLCDGVLIDATTLPECHHAFCRSCLVHYCTRTNVDVFTCPVLDCGAEIHTSRPLEKIKNDTTLQTVVYKLFPDAYEDEMLKRREFYRLHPQTVFPGYLHMQRELTREELGIIQNPSWLPRPVPKSAIVTLRYLCVVSDRAPAPKRLLEKDVQVKKQSVLRYSVGTDATFADLKETVGVMFHLPLEYPVVVLLTNIIMEDTSSLSDVIRFFPTKQPGALAFDFVLTDITSFPDHVSMEAAILRTIRRLPPVGAPISVTFPSTSAFSFSDNVPLSANPRRWRKSRKRAGTNTSNISTISKMPKTTLRNETLYPPIQPPSIVKRKRGRLFKSSAGLQNASSSRAILSMAEEAYFDLNGPPSSPVASTSKSLQEESDSDVAIEFPVKRKRGRPSTKKRPQALKPDSQRTRLNGISVSDVPFGFPAKKTRGPDRKKRKPRLQVPMQDAQPLVLNVDEAQPFPMAASIAVSQDELVHNVESEYADICSKYDRLKLQMPKLEEQPVSTVEDVVLPVKEYFAQYFDGPSRSSVKETDDDDNDGALADLIRKSAVEIESRLAASDMDLKIVIGSRKRNKRKEVRMGDLGSSSRAQVHMSERIRAHLDEIMEGPTESLYMDHGYVAEPKVEKSDEARSFSGPKELGYSLADYSGSLVTQLVTLRGDLERIFCASSKSGGRQSESTASEGNELRGQSDSDSVTSHASKAWRDQQDGKSERGEVFEAPANSTRFFSPSLVGLA
ncbi:hypothetical protein RvY_11806 [Ramazzottius varieornatus]|uniref:RING-type domain-containing protein n=1 Tax=Ramazzottius varieornatus TaxID=947166 RepID=A0A1D1VJC0_RAMVA|nr:hypothetical protein RvY_11806 [Ramazzottius varieornatus]